MLNTIVLNSPLEQFTIHPILICFLDSTNETGILLILLLFFFFLIRCLEKLTGYENRGFTTAISTRLQTFALIIFRLALSLCVENIQSKRAELFLPFIFTIFSFIMILNTIGMIPYSFTLTSHLAVTLTISLASFIGVNIFLSIEKKACNFFFLSVFFLFPNSLFWLIVRGLILLVFYSFFIIILQSAFLTVSCNPEGDKGGNSWFNVVWDYLTQTHGQKEPSSTIQPLSVKTLSQIKVTNSDLVSEVKIPISVNSTGVPTKIVFGLQQRIILNEELMRLKIQNIIETQKNSILSDEIASIKRDSWVECECLKSKNRVLLRTIEQKDSLIKCFQNPDYSPDYSPDVT